MDTIRYQAKNTKTVAHRGVSGLEKENSLLAFTAAGNRSYYGVETDVHKTADGKFVVIHDRNTLRVSGTACDVEETAFDIIRHIKLIDVDGSNTRNDIRIPSLSEYIAICKKYEKHAVLELKSTFTSEELAHIIDEINKYEWLEHVTFIAFDFENLVRLREILPNQSVQYLTKYISDELIEQLKNHKMDIDADYRYMTKEWVDKLHSAGIVINVWTVNNPEDGERLADWGVDYITSNILE